MEKEHKKFKLPENSLAKLCAKYLKEMLDAKEEQQQQQFNILDDNFYLLCNQLSFYLNENSEENHPLLVTTIATHFYYQLKELRSENYVKLELLNELEECVKSFIEKLICYLNESNNSSNEELKKFINKILKLNGQIKFYKYKNTSLQLTASFDYQNKYLELKLIKNYLYGFYIEYNQLVKDFIEILKNNNKTEQSQFNQSALQFMQVLLVFKVLWAFFLL